jgi:hypothetical protein
MLGKNEMENRYGPQPNDASPFMRKCRLLQSWYRVEVLREPACGPWRPGGRIVGSTLVNGETSGSNFLGAAAFAYAKEKVAEKASNPDLTIDEHRLFNNMLSSHPMCFNLFADLRAGVQRCCTNATAVLRAVFPESSIVQVASVEVEMVPRPTSQYIDDKTGFDAAVLFTDGQGRPGLASIETKYTDKLGNNTATKQDRKFHLADDLGLLTPEGCRWYATQGFDQVARNLLLTLAYARRHGLHSAINYVLAPQEDQESQAVVATLQARLAEAFSHRIVWLPLEMVVQRGLAVADAPLAEHLRQFHRRYLAFDQIRHLLVHR